MWKPDKPIIVAGSALPPAEAWWHEFRSAFYDRCNGAVDREWLDSLAAALYPLNVDRDPRQAAEVAFVTLAFELPREPQI
ncbi:hypothetical protein ASC78_01660 [Variovorax sp. Root318D1]|uniref:hypothetical protein n=1 Tax=Variovorax sp. Root318D1 TaxID=1736513 RepID=UPI000701072A|nr:hypothetical protein [Variovorax sp. Root318D1]KQU91659.1 hypothetical protein ASC78_01660 [Variovorax sp. Root318D1]